MNLHKFSIKELQSILERHEISSVELTQYYLDRIDKLNPILNCYVHLDHEYTLEMARNADNMREKGFKHPLLGIPIAHKDIICTETLPTTCCSKMLEGYVSPFSATFFKV